MNSKKQVLSLSLIFEEAVWVHQPLVIQISNGDNVTQARGTCCSSFNCDDSFIFISGADAGPNSHPSCVLWVQVGTVHQPHGAGQGLPGPFPAAQAD